MRDKGYGAIMFFDWKLNEIGPQRCDKFTSYYKDIAIDAR
jgi:hypothetical protein